jgi:hypothetical protein
MAKKKEPAKRLVKYANFEQLDADVEMLLTKGYRSNGNWNLAQTLTHVANWMSYPLDGFPKPPIFIRPIFWLMKVTVGARMKRQILAEGFKGGMPTAPQSVPEPSEHSDQEAFELLKQTIDRVRNHQGDLLPSPLFGPMDKETLLTVTLLHAEHHLGYLEPKH